MIPTELGKKRLTKAEKIEKLKADNAVKKSIIGDVFDTALENVQKEMAYRLGASIDALVKSQEPPVKPKMYEDYLSLSDMAKTVEKKFTPGMLYLPQYDGAAQAAKYQAMMQPTSNLPIPGVEKPKVVKAPRSEGRFFREG